MMSTIVSLQQGHYYHIYNRGNNRENVFVEPGNYTYFLDLYKKHIVPIADIFAYCLMKNHFHLLIQVKENSESVRESSRCFGNLFNAYARTINQSYHRTGALFQRPFGRINVTTERHFAALVVYIHRNPQKHGFVVDFRNWPYSSYHTLLSSRPTILQRESVQSWFGGTEAFIAAHQLEPDASDIVGNDAF